MAVICPTITAYSFEEYIKQLNNVKQFAHRIHLDIMDGRFTEVTSVNLSDILMLPNLTVDIHLMCQSPMDYMADIKRLKPSTVIIHNEVEVHHMVMAAELQAAGIKAGLALLQDTPVDWADQIMHSFDQVLIFSGNLGHHGGQADLKYLDKVRQVKTDHPTAEVAWDGGINDSNVRQLVDGGVDVLNVGGYIQNSENPEKAYAKIMEQIT